MSPATVVFIGLLVVFSGIVILIVSIAIMNLLISLFTGNKEEEKKVQPAPEVQTTVDNSGMDHNTLVAVISSSIVAYSGSNAKGIRIVSIKKM